MSRRRQTLFEQIRPGTTTSRDRLRLPKWAQPRSGDDQTEPPGPSDASPARPFAWLAHPVGFRLTRGMVAVLLLIVVALLIGAYVIGTRRAKHNQQITGPLADLRNGPINDALLNPDAVSFAPDPPNGSNHADSNVPGPRKPGLNYFIIMQVGKSYRDDADRAVDFMARHGIDCQVVPVKNKADWNVVVLRGFAQPRTDPQALALRQELLALGRIWKSQQNGANNWSDLYPAKYEGP